MLETDNTQAELEAKQPSEIPKIFGFIMGFAGVYFLIIGLFSVLTLVILQSTSSETGAASSEEIYALISAIASIFISGIAIWAGVKLIKYRDSGRKILNFYTAAVIIFYSLRYFYKKGVIEKSFANVPPEMAAAPMGAELSGLLTLFIFPAILMVVTIIINLKGVRRSLAR